MHQLTMKPPMQPPYFFPGAPSEIGGARCEGNKASAVETPVEMNNYYKNELEGLKGQRHQFNKI